MPRRRPHRAALEREALADWREQAPERPALSSVNDLLETMPEKVMGHAVWSRRAEALFRRREAHVRKVRLDRLPDQAGVIAEIRQRLAVDPARAVVLAREALRAIPEALGRDELYAEWLLALPALLASGEWIWDCCPPDGVEGAVALLVARGCGTERVLPALVLASRGMEYCEQIQVVAEVERFLRGLDCHRERWSAEDRWLAGLRGVPREAPDWLVYEDWLEEQGDDRAHLLRWDRRWQRHQSGLYSYWFRCPRDLQHEAGRRNERHWAWLDAYISVSSCRLS